MSCVSDGVAERGEAEPDASHAPAVGFTILAVAVAFGSGSHPAAGGAAAGPSRDQVLQAYANLPLTFWENRGQTNTQVRYFTQGSRYSFAFTREQILLSLAKGSRGVNLALQFLSSNPEVAVEGEERAPGRVNYLRGNDPKRWRTNVPGFTRVIYRALWPGVDLVLRGQGGTLKYEFRVRPGARPADIRQAYRGAQRLRVNRRGALLIETAVGVLRDSAPLAYQWIDGARVPVDSRYVVKGRSYGFEAAAGYEPNHELVIDPGLAYSTFLGGSSHDSGNDIAVDASGNAFVTGFTQSPDFRTTAGAFDRTGSASNDLDVFVSKLNATGTGLVYSTFLGGSNFDWGRGLAIDSAGNAYVTGQTKSSNFPTTGSAFDRTFNIDTCPRCGIDQYDAFVAKLNASGSGLCTRRSSAGRISTTVSTLHSTRRATRT